MPGEAQERGQQRDRGGHHDQDDDRDGDPARGHERDAGDGETEDRDDDGAPGEDHGPAGGGDGASGRLRDGQPAGEVLAVSHDQEQGVVDADPEADHAADDRSPAGDVDQVGDERHRADGEGEAEDRHPDREGHGDQRAERQQQDDRRGRKTEDLARARLALLEGEEQVATHLDPQRKALPGPEAELLEVVQDGPVQLFERRIVDPDQGDPSVGRHRSARHRGVRSRGQRTGRVGGADRGGQVVDHRLDLGHGGPRVSRGEERRPVVERSHDHLCGGSDLVGPGGREQVGGFLGVETRRAERVLELAAERPGRSEHEHRDDEPGPDHGPRAARGETAQSVESLRHHR